MTKALVHESAVTVTESDVISNEAYPLVRELAHVYGLQVIHKETPNNPIRSRLYMAREDGVCVGYVKYSGEEGFVFRNVMVRKERGGRSSDAHWMYYSNKLPYLMRMIKKEKLIPSSSDEVLVRDEMMLTGIPNNYVSHFGDTRKVSNLNGEDAHKLLEIVFGYKDATEYPIESINNFKSLLDKYRELDTMSEKRREYLRDILDKNLWVVSYDSAKTFSVGKIKVNYELREDSGYMPATFKELHITQTFKRHKSLHEVPEIMPKMTMLKVHMEQSQRDHRLVDDIMPIMNGTIPELDVVTYRTGANWYEAPLKPSWIIFPSDS